MNFFNRIPAPFDRTCHSQVYSPSSKVSGEATDSFLASFTWNHGRRGRVGEKAWHDVISDVSNDADITFH
jgi:hypothetical protein